MYLAEEHLFKQQGYWNTVTINQNLENHCSIIIGVYVEDLRWGISQRRICLVTLLLGTLYFTLKKFTIKAFFVCKSSFCWNQSFKASIYVILAIMHSCHSIIYHFPLILHFNKKNKKVWQWTCTKANLITRLEQWGIIVDSKLRKEFPQSDDEHYQTTIPSLFF